MLFRLPRQSPLPGLSALLGTWNTEADEFRVAAIAAQGGAAPSTLVVEAAEAAQHDLAELLADLDRALDQVPSGQTDFAGLLQARLTAAALAESIDTSLDRLARFVPEPVGEPHRISHEPAADAGSAK